MINNDILTAIYNNDIEKFKSLSNSIEKTEFKTVLYLCCEHNYYKILSFLLEKEKINSESFNICLDIAASNGSFESVKYLLNHNKKHYKFILNDNKALQVSVREEFVDIVNLILEDNQIDPTLYNNSAIKIAIEIDNKKIIKTLWKKHNVKKYFKEHDKELYNEICKSDVQDKVKQF